MKTDLAMTNESFSFLKGSSEFLNIVLNNVNCCVLLLDKDVRLRAFNDALKTMFSNKKNENLLYVKCGEALGCAYQVEEQKECGETSKCCDCELRIAALNSYTNNEFIYNNYITKPFLNFNNEKIDKYLRFSTRLFIFKKEKYIIMMVEDFTNFNKHEKNVS